MKGWKEYTINDIAEVTSSKRIFLSEYVSDGIPFYRSKEVIEKSNGNDISLELFIKKEQFENIKKKFGAPEENDILLTSVGTIGVPYKVKKDETFYFKDGNLTWIRKYKGEVDPNFLLQWIKSELGQQTILQNTIGSSQPALTIAAIKKIKLSLPPLPTQKRIASILSAYDDLIEVNNQRIKLLEQTARELYKEWFVRMRFPGYKKVNFKKGIPEGWEIVKLHKLVTTQYGFTASATSENVGMKYLRITDVADSMINWDNVPYCLISEKESKKYLLENGDIVVARTGATVGFAKRLNKFHKPAVFASYLVRLKPKDFVFNSYLGIILESDNYKEYIQTVASGAAQPQANAGLMTGFSLFKPIDSLLKKFNLIVEPMFDQIEILQQQNSQLRQIRDRLLPRLVSGKLQLKETNN